MSKVSIRKMVVAAAVAAGLGAAVLSGGVLSGAESAGGPAPRPVDAGASESVPLSTVATARGHGLEIFEQPGRGSAAVRELPNPRPSGAPLVLLVVDHRPDWLQVQLPERPNGSTGWVRAGDVKTSRHQFRIEVSLSAHVLTAFDGDRQILETPAAIGERSTPTPTGHFYTTELLRPPNPGGAYGPYAFGLSAHSDVLTDFAGGDGTVGIHGTNDPSSLGTDASHGCIRIDNDAITLLAESLPVGTPVDILP